MVSERIKCPGCGEKFGNIGTHWNRGACDRPDFSETQEEMISGLLLGDGYVSRQKDKNPIFRLQMTNKEFLEWIDSEFGVLSTGVRLQGTAEERAKRDRESGFNKNADPDQYSDMWVLNTRSHDGLSDFAAWYDTGEKTPPTDIRLTPTQAKMWYVSDGSLEKRPRGKIRVQIASSSYVERGCDVLSWFDNSPFNPKLQSGYVRFDSDESEEFLSWIGEPVPGFIYKW